MQGFSNYAAEMEVSLKIAFTNHEILQKGKRHFCVLSCTSKPQFKSNRDYSIICKDKKRHQKAKILIFVKRHEETRESFLQGPDTHALLLVSDPLI